MESIIARLLSTERLREKNNDLEFYLFAKYMNQNSREMQDKYIELANRTTLFHIDVFREFATYILLQQKSKPFLPDESSSFIQDAIKYLWDERFQLVQNNIKHEEAITFNCEPDESKGKFISKEAIKIFLKEILSRNPDRDLKKEAFDQLALIRAKRENLNKNSKETKSVIKKQPIKIKTQNGKRRHTYFTRSQNRNKINHHYFTRSQTLGCKR